VLPSTGADFKANCKHSKPQRSYSLVQKSKNNV
jgi:hypothetical protein